MSNGEFNGFPKESLTFFAELELNNEKKWFDAHRSEYEQYVLEPSRAFVVAMGEKLHKHYPAIHAEPAVNRSLFRLNRDTRFSKDKRPYKTHMSMMFWEGERRRMECPCFYFHVEGDELMLGAGIYMFPKDMLESYREAVADRKAGKELAKVVADLTKKKFGIGIEGYKRVPRGYDPDHENAALLRHTGLTAVVTRKIPREYFTGKIVDYSLERFRRMYPMNKWLLKHV